MSARLPQVRMLEALGALDVMLGWDSPWIPTFTNNGGGERIFYHRARRPGSSVGLGRLVQRCDELRSEEITLGLPEMRRFAGPIRSTVLWVRVESVAAARKASRLPCMPSMVVREGSSARRTLLWWLDRPVDYFACEELNRKLAYACGAVQKHGVPERLRIPAPGTCLRVGRSRPVPVIVSRLDPQCFEPAHVVWRLKQPPDPQAWMDNKRSKGEWR